MKWYEKDGVLFFNLEECARGLGFVEIKDGKEYVMWRRVSSYLSDFGFDTCAEKESFIPENVFYRLAMKAKNETAENIMAFATSVFSATGIKGNQFALIEERGLTA